MKQVKILKAGLNSQGVSYELDGDIKFKYQFISHELIIDLFLKDRGLNNVRVFAEESITKTPLPVSDELVELRRQNEIMREALTEVKKDIEANASDTLWCHEGYAMTVVDRIEIALSKCGNGGSVYQPKAKWDITKHIHGKVYDLTPENMNAMIADIEKLMKGK